MRPCCLEVKKMAKEGDMEVDDKRTQDPRPCRHDEVSPVEIHMSGHARFLG
jgi:hypothetical protein